ncbi:MAG: CapA family protein, partial [Holophagales bacterium]|nr:CapA family protein [Holophagales bacterium]
MPPRITLAGVGDCIPSRRISNRRDRGLLEVIELLRGVDCTWGNCETVLGDPRQLSGWPKGFDPHVLCEPWGAEELRWLGIDCVGTANNHSFDWGPEGLLSTLESLERAAVPQAGCGTDLAQASRPSYFDSPAGRVGQVCCASSFESYGVAGPAHPHVMGRPGLNPLGLSTAVQMPAAVMEQLEGLSWKLMEARGWASAFGDFLKPFLARLPKGAELVDETMVLPGDDFDLLETVDASAQQRIVDAIGVARNNARLVITSIHAHQSRFDLEQSPAFLEGFARATVDAGTDVFFATGPHVLRGIEIYNGKAIFYGLGNFLFQYETAAATPAGSYTAFGLPSDTVDRSQLAALIPYPAAERYWQSAVPVLTFEGGNATGNDDSGPRLVSIDLYPITLGQAAPSYDRGIPET